MNASGDKWPDDSKQKLKLEKLLPSFKFADRELLNLNETRLPRKCVSTLLVIAHDSKLGGHFKTAKTLSRLSNFHWRHKARDVKNYGKGWMKCQQLKDSSQKKID